MALLLQFFSVKNELKETEHFPISTSKSNLHIHGNDTLIPLARIQSKNCAGREQADC